MITTENMQELYKWYLVRLQIKVFHRIIYIYMYYSVIKNTCIYNRSSLHLITIQSIGYKIQQQILICPKNNTYAYT